MDLQQRDDAARARLAELARDAGLDIDGAPIRRTSSRFCLGVEHGDYNGTELFGIGTDRFLWSAVQPNGTGRLRLFSGNFAGEGVVEFAVADVATAVRSVRGWARYATGVVAVLERAGLGPIPGVDVVLHGEIPGGGMSRSASLCINLITALLDVIGKEPADRFRIVEWAQQVENDFVGSPCGILDQTMILFAKAGMGTHFDPATRAIRHVPLGAGGEELRFVAMDTGTVRPGLEQSTYRLRRAECDEFVGLLQAAGFAISSLADLAGTERCAAARAAFADSHPHLVARLDYLDGAQRNFAAMLEAWRAGDITRLGALFRADGHGLRDLYRISGPELETMCDLARTVEGVLGERMLGGGDKGAAGALIHAEAFAALREAVARGYPRSHPECADRHALHELRLVDGVAVV